MNETCFQCFFSIARYVEDCGSVLWCDLKGDQAEKRCEKFEREPGTMEREE